MTTGSKMITVVGEQPTESTTEKAPPARFWLNIGVRLSDGTFVSLPVGIAVDSQAEKLAGINAKKPATTPKMQALRKFQEELIVALEAVSQTVPAGQGVPFTEFPNGMQLSFEIRHVQDGEKTENVVPTTLGLLSKKVA
jgi:hypothetical protein